LSAPGSSSLLNVHDRYLSGFVGVADFGVAAISPKASSTE